MKNLIWLLLLLLLAACSPQPAPAPSQPTSLAASLMQIGVVTGAEPLMPLIEANYAENNPQVELQFVVGNSAALHNDLAVGLLDAILTYHIPEGNGRYFNPVALDGVVIITHPSNPINELSSAQIQAIFNGRINNWQAVGGNNEPIVLLSREEGSGLRTVLRLQLMAEQRISPNGLLQPNNKAMQTAVANNAAAIGFSSMGSAVQNSGVKMLMVDGRSATSTSASDQTYSLTTPLYFLAATQAEPTGELRAFLAWLQSETGQELLGNGYGRVR